MTVQITAYLACAGIPGICFVFSRLVACWHDGFVRTGVSYYRKGHTLRCYLRVQCFSFSGLVACSHAVFVRTFLITERVTICVAICVCTVLILRDWSHDHFLIYFARANRYRKFSDMFGETR